MYTYTTLSAVLLNPGAIQYASNVSHMGPLDMCVGPWASCVITRYKTLGRQVLFSKFHHYPYQLPFLSVPVACSCKVLNTEKSTPVLGTCRLYRVVSKDNMAAALAASSAYLFPLAFEVVSRV